MLGFMPHPNGSTHRSSWILAEADRAPALLSRPRRWCASKYFSETNSSTASKLSMRLFARAFSSALTLRALSSCARFLLFAIDAQSDKTPTLAGIFLAISSRMAWKSPLPIWSRIQVVPPPFEARSTVSGSYSRSVGQLWHEDAPACAYARMVRNVGFPDPHNASAGGGRGRIRRQVTLKRPGM
jgi:hypothetical protein